MSALWLTLLKGPSATWGPREVWFQQLIQSAGVTAMTGRYHDFAAMARSTP
jgi:hypothetical protein